ncbi:MAG: tetratricopeptide repeat protein, partial [Acetobacter sp.]|nr:tetratricopeptide repeat protein [Acetobacter sp.]
MSFIPTDWSQLPSTYDGQRPQDIINDMILKKVDYCVFVIHDHLGSCSGSKGDVEQTGIEEEWSLAEQMRKERKIRGTALLWKKVDRKRRIEPDDKLKKVLDFLEKNKHQGLYKEYETMEEFREELRACLSEWETPSVQNNKDENSSPFLLSGGFPSSKECEPDNGQEPPSFHYWMQEVNQLLECGIKKQNSTLYLFPEEYRNALFCANKALEAAKSKVETVQALNSVGRTKFYLRDYQGAIECCDEIIKKFGGEESELSLKEQVARALYNKGVVLSQVGQREESVKSYDEVIRRFGGESELSLKEQVARALVNKGVALSQVGQREESVKSYDEVIRRFGGESELSLKEQVA